MRGALFLVRQRPEAPGWKLLEEHGMDWEDYQSSQHPEAQSVMQEMRNAMYCRHKVLHEGKRVPWCSAPAAEARVCRCFKPIEP